jgi:probable rRNA maturation factor
MITIKNKQRTAINLDLLHKQAAFLLQALGYSDFELNILIATEKQMHQFNKQYRSKDKPTDVLSFPYHQLTPNKKATFEEDERILGDLILAPAYILKDAQKLGISYEDRLRHLVIHGVLHLLGYDHISDADYKKMRRQELAMERKLQTQKLV